MRNAPVAVDSAALVRRLTQQVDDNWGGVAAFNNNDFSISTYTVKAGIKKTRVQWDNCQSKPFLPSQLYNETMGAHFRQVPVPRSARPAPGTDGALAIYDPSTDKLWEFWQANRQADGLHACWGGRIDDVSRNPGFFPDGMGLTATGLSSVGGSIGIKEARLGRIRHAISLNVIDAAHFSKVSYPAQRSDGAGSASETDLLREGQRLRLDPTIDISTLGLHPLAAAVAQAAQRYGFIVNDKGGAVAVIAENGAGIAARVGIDPWSRLLKGTPSYAVMKGFPWSGLQALPVDYGKP